MTETIITVESLLKVRKGAVDFVDVPEFGFAAVTGSGAAGGSEFNEALQALYAVSYGAHFLLKKQRGLSRSRPARSALAHGGTPWQRSRARS